MLPLGVGREAEYGELSQSWRRGRTATGKPSSGEGGNDWRSKAALEFYLLSCTSSQLLQMEARRDADQEEGRRDERENGGRERERK